MKDRLQLPFRFDAAAMQSDLRRIEDEAWVRHFVTQNYEGDWTVLPLRAPSTATHPVQMIYSDPACTEYADTALLAACPSIAAALTAFDCPLESVRLMRLGAGSIIKTHSDHDLDVEHGRVRLHIPIETNPDVDFRLNDERVALGEGECWYLRLSDPHSVANRGLRDRIHLVVDAIVSPWLHEQLELADAASGFQLPASGSRLSVSGSQLPASGSRLPELPAWIPARVRADATVEWCEVGNAAFTDPFLGDTIERAKGASGLVVTPFDVLLAEAAAHPGIAPSGFIFHCSRCGSTLVSQLARALPGTVVLSEAPAIDDVLRSGWAHDRKVAALRGVVTALGQPRAPEDRHLFIKFDAWHVLDVALVQEAFPRVPCLFVYRNPAEVIASQMRMPGQYLLPGALDPRIAGLASVDEVMTAGREGYCARVLGRLLTAAAELARDGRLDLMSYAQCPDAAIDRVLAWTGRQANEIDRRRLLELASFDAKTPNVPFAASRDPLRQPSGVARAAAAAFADAPFATLDQLNRARG
jgi:hypothetical protein